MTTPPDLATGNIESKATNYLATLLESVFESRNQNPFQPLHRWESDSKAYVVRGKVDFEGVVDYQKNYEENEKSTYRRSNIHDKLNVLVEGDIRGVFHGTPFMP
jgi:hypothetical protein